MFVKAVYELDTWKIKGGSQDIKHFPLLLREAFPLSMFDNFTSPTSETIEPVFSTVSAPFTILNSHSKSNSILTSISTCLIMLNCKNICISRFTSSVLLLRKYMKHRKLNCLLRMPRSEACFDMSSAASCWSENQKLWMRMLINWLEY